MTLTLIQVLSLVMVEFLIYRFILVVIGHVFTKISKSDKHFYHEKELAASILLYAIFTFIYFKTMIGIMPSLIDEAIDTYLLMVVYAVFSVLWAYLSWDMDHWFRPITFANTRDVTIKKGIIFTVVLVGGLWLGLHQTKAFAGISDSNPLYSIANISILTIIIALDRVVFQIYLLTHKEEKDD